MKSLVYDHRPNIENAKDIQDRIFVATQRIRDHMPNCRPILSKFTIHTI